MLLPAAVLAATGLFVVAIAANRQKLHSPHVNVAFDPSMNEARRALWLKAAEELGLVVHSSGALVTLYVPYMRHGGVDALLSNDVIKARMALFGGNAILCIFSLGHTPERYAAKNERLADDKEGFNMNSFVTWKSKADWHKLHSRLLRFVIDPNRGGLLPCKNNTQCKRELFELMYLAEQARK